MAREVRRWPSQQGTVLLCALMVTTLLAMLAAALVMIVTTEAAISGNHRTGLQALYAADSAIERAIGVLAGLPTWDLVPGIDAGMPADLDDGSSAPRVPGGGVPDLARLTAQRQAASDAVYGLSANRPTWRLFAHAPIARMIPGEPDATPVYLVVWIADDVEDGDGNPAIDSNRVLLVHAEAFGFQGARRRVQVTLERVPPTDDAEDDRALVQRAHIRVLGWRENP